MDVIDGVVEKITGEDMVISTELGDKITLPRYAGETPPVGSAVQIDFSTGSPKLYSTPPIALIEKVDRFMNFYALPEENPSPEVDTVAGTASSGGEKSIYGPFTPFSFMDSPVGARTLSASNGNVCFAGQTAVGFALSCDTKLIAKSTGQMELVTSHFTSLQGRTVIVSSFRDNISIEIDILNSDSQTTANFTGIKEAIIKDMIGTEEKVDEETKEVTPAIDPLTYENAFELRYPDSEHPAFTKMFGLHLAEILTLVQWERVRFRGDEKTFHETFDGIADFQNYIGYCSDCYENGEIMEMEFFLVLGDSNDEGASIRVPQCEEQVIDAIYPVTAKINEEQYTVTAMNINMRSGTRIEYVARRRIYSLSHGVVAKKSFVASDQQGVFSNKLHVDVDKISFSNLSFDNGVPDFCGNDTNLPAIYWNGDFLLSVSGTLSLASVGNLTIASSVQSIIAGGTRGIKIDSSGSTAITF